MSFRNNVIITTSLLSIFSLMLGDCTAAEEWEHSLQDNKYESATLTVSAKSTSSESPGRIGFVCFPDTTAGLYFEAEILAADSIKDFRLDDFEGPDAPYGDHELGTLKLKAGKRVIVLSSSGTGWYADNNRFKLSLPLDDIDLKQRAAIHALLQGELSAIEVSFHEFKNKNRTLTFLATGKWDLEPIRIVLKACEFSTRKP